MEASAPGGLCLPEVPYCDNSVEAIAARLQTPLELLKQSAEGLAEQLREGAGDPFEISAAETLVHSAERMRRIVQALLDEVHGEAG